MRVLAITKIFPNRLEPLSSPFNRQQFKALAARCDLTVLEAIPWVPGARFTRVPSRAAMLSQLPARDFIEGIETIYMRQLYVPKVGLVLAVPLYLASLAPYVALARASDVVFATWAYPDACAAIVLARAVGKPCVFKVHGSDVNVIGQRPSARAVMRRLLPLADRAVAVSAPLAGELAAMGVRAERIEVVPNGVDTALFAPKDKGVARRALGIAETGPILMFAGRLEPQKGLGELLRAFAIVRAKRADARLVLVGDGVMREGVASLVGSSGGSVLAPGARPLAEVATWLAACDVFTLPSWAEGTPNVVLEALAAGRPVVATNVGGIPDAIGSAGRLVPPHDAEALAAALLDAMSVDWDPQKVRACGPGSWEESADRLHAVLASASRRPHVEASTAAISGGTTP